MKRFFTILLCVLLLLPAGQGFAAKKMDPLEEALTLFASGETDLRAHPLTGAELEELFSVTGDTPVLYSVNIDGYTFDGASEVIDFGTADLRKIKELQAALPYLPNVKEIDMYSCHIGLKNMETLWSARPDIHWGWTLRYGSHVIRTDIEAFSTLHTARSKRSNSAAYEPLKYCWQLKALDLGHNAITDISFIGYMKELRVLILADNRIRDISPLAGLDKLQYVELFMNRITDLSPLAGAPELLDLNLCHGSFVDLDAVLTMPKLERLWVSKHKNTPEGYFEELSAKLPNVEFYEDKTGSTNGTWRTHERYQIIHEMFQTYTYIPFPEN